MTIKQPKGSGMCAVCVAAMATNTTTAEVYAFLNDGRQPGDPIHDPELAMYVLKHGWAMGQGWQISHEDDPKGVKISGPGDITLRVDGLAGTRAYLAVKSRNYPDYNHAVYWDGSVVRDPDPSMPDEVPISEYELVTVWPLTWIGWNDLTGRLECKPSSLPYFVRRWRRMVNTRQAYNQEAPE